MTNKQEQCWKNLAVVSKNMKTIERQNQYSIFKQICKNIKAIIFHTSKDISASKNDIKRREDALLIDMKNEIDIVLIKMDEITKIFKEESFYNVENLSKEMLEKITSSKYQREHFKEINSLVLDLYYNISSFTKIAQKNIEYIVKDLENIWDISNKTFELKWFIDQLNQEIKLLQSKENHYAGKGAHITNIDKHLYDSCYLVSGDVVLKVIANVDKYINDAVIIMNEMLEGFQEMNEALNKVN